MRLAVLQYQTQGEVAEGRRIFHASSLPAHRRLMMRRRLYWLLPDVESARRTADDLLLARIEDRHMHFLARRGTDLRSLHEASVLQKTDIRHAPGRGLFVGALIGALAAWVMTQYPIDGR